MFKKLILWFKFKYVYSSRWWRKKIFYEVINTLFKECDIDLAIITLIEVSKYKNIQDLNKDEIFKEVMKLKILGWLLSKKEVNKNGRSKNYKNIWKKN